MIPVLGFATVSRFDLAQKLLDSIDYPVKDLVIVDNSGRREFNPVKPDLVENMWLIQVPNGLGANGAWNLIIKSTPFAPYWVIPNDDCQFAPGALEIIAQQVDPEKFNFPEVIPQWSCVIPGEGAVKKAGLWDEAFHPIYFDDDDYQRRMCKLGVEFNYIPARVNHQNSSSLTEANNKTFLKNRDLHQRKINSDDFSVHGWDLTTRRNNAWDIESR